MEGEENEDEYEVRQRINNADKKYQPYCNTRIDRLAIPNRRLILSLYQTHAYHFEKERAERIKQFLQELYAMTPEETEKYFAHLRDAADKVAQRKNLRHTITRILRKKKKQRERKRAYKFVEKLLTSGMIHAFVNPVPPLLSVRLRNLADIVLEQICDLRNVELPDRENPDQVGLFLIALADWIAIAIEHIYYGMQLKKNKELQELDALEEQRKLTIPKQKMDSPEAKTPTTTDFGEEDVLDLYSPTE